MAAFFSRCLFVAIIKIIQTQRKKNWSNEHVVNKRIYFHSHWHRHANTFEAPMDVYSVSSRAQYALFLYRRTTWNWTGRRRESMSEKMLYLTRIHVLVGSMWRDCIMSSVFSLSLNFLLFLSFINGKRKQTNFRTCRWMHEFSSWRRFEKCAETKLNDAWKKNYNTINSTGNTAKRQSK